MNRDSRCSLGANAADIAQPKGNGGSDARREVFALKPANA